MDLGGKEREKKGGGGEASSGCLWSFVCVWGGAESKSAGRLYFIQFISQTPTGPSLHPGSLAAVLHLGPDHLLLRQLFQLRLFPFTDATPLTPKSLAFSPSLIPFFLPLELDQWFSNPQSRPHFLAENAPLDGLSHEPL